MIGNNRFSMIFLNDPQAYMMSLEKYIFKTNHRQPIMLLYNIQKKYTNRLLRMFKNIFLLCNYTV